MKYLLWSGFAFGLGLAAKYTGTIALADDWVPGVPQYRLYLYGAGLLHLMIFILPVWGLFRIRSRPYILVAAFVAVTAYGLGNLATLTGTS